MRALQQTISPYGLVVYAYPDDSHLIASTPEDHTSFSATGYPTTAPRWVGNAIDIMPRNSTAAAKKEAANLARQIIRDKNAGIPGTEHIKYMNWTDEQGICRQERWMPNHTTRSSSDKNHIHLSGLSTWARKAAPFYDPIARMRAAASGGDDMSESWTKPITQGPTGIAGHQRDTALAYAWFHALTANNNTQALLVMAKADEARDNAMQAAINALAAEGDAQAVIDAIRTVREESATSFATMMRELQEEQAAQLAAIRDELRGQAGPLADLVLAKLASAGVGSAATHEAMVAAVNEAFDEAFQGGRTE